MLNFLYSHLFKSLKYSKNTLFKYSKNKKNFITEVRTETDHSCLFYLKDKNVTTMKYESEEIASLIQVCNYLFLMYIFL